MSRKLFFVRFLRSLLTNGSVGTWLLLIHCASIVEALSWRLQHVVWIVTPISVSSYFLPSSRHFPFVFLSNFCHLPFAKMEVARQRVLVQASVVAHKKEKEGVSTSAPKVVGKGRQKGKMKGKMTVPLRKDQSSPWKTNKRSRHLLNPATELVKVWWRRRVPSPKGPSVIFLLTRSTLLRWWSPSLRTWTWILVLSKRQKSWGRQVFLTFLGYDPFF